MGDLVFNGIKVEELDLTNKIEGAVSLDISQRASFNVKLTIDMMDKNQPMDFNFKISAVAFFDCDQLSDKREIHKKAYDEIFPHVRSMVITFFVNSGLPPIAIPKVKMDDANIKVSGEDNSEEDKIYS